MKRLGYTFLIISILLLPSLVKAQEYYATNINPDKQNPISTLDLMPNVYPAIVEQGDTIACMWLDDFIKYPQSTFRNNREQNVYTNLIRDVKKTLTYD